MKVVIDIPEETYDEVCTKENPYRWLYEDVALEAIQKGKQLPKGHGRLIDADELKKHKYHDNDRFESAVAVAQIDWADTIIEADKEGERE